MGRRNATCSESEKHSRRGAKEAIAPAGQLNVYALRAGISRERYTS